MFEKLVLIDNIKTYCILNACCKFPIYNTYPLIHKKKKYNPAYLQITGDGLLVTEGKKNSDPLTD